MSSVQYAFRQPISVQELMALRKVSYNAYRESRLHKFCPDNKLGIQLDCHDLYALHFGLFRESSGESKPVGYIRLVTDEISPMYYDVVSIASLDETLLENVLKLPDELYPVIEYVPFAERLRKLHEELRRDGIKLVEASRLSLDPSVQGRKLEEYALANFMISSVFAATKVYGIDAAMMAVAPSHKPTYERFGFGQLDQTEIFYPEKFDGGPALLLLLGLQEQLPSLQKGKILRMADEYARSGQIVYHAHTPGTRRQQQISAESLSVAA